jgi:hypothetical protein
MTAPRIAPDVTFEIERRAVERENAGAPCFCDGGGRCTTESMQRAGCVRSCRMHCITCDRRFVRHSVVGGFE